MQPRKDSPQKNGPAKQPGKSGILLSGAGPDPIFVIPTTLRWPHQSLIADWLQLKALNTGDYTPADLADVRVDSLRLSLRRDWLPTPFEDVEQLITLKALRVCPRCWAAGYHAAFHALPWIPNCLVHPEIALVWNGGYWIEGVKVGTPGTDPVLPKPADVARRGAFPEEAKHRISRYREFVQASRQWDPISAEAYLRDLDGRIQCSEGAKLTHPNALVDEEQSVIAGVSVVASRLGFDDLVRTALRAKVPQTESVQVPLAPASPHQSKFRGTVTPYWGADSESDETRRMLIRFGATYKHGQRLNADDTENIGRHIDRAPATGRYAEHEFVRAEALSMHSAYGDGVPEAVSNVHRAFECVLSKVAAEPDGCPRAAKRCSSKPTAYGVDRCAFCSAIRRWRYIICDPERITTERAYKEIVSGVVDRHWLANMMLRRSLPFLRQIDLPESPELDAILEQFLALDTTTYFFAHLEAELMLPREGPTRHPYSFWVLRNRAWLYERYLARRRPTSAEFIFWQLPNVEARVRHAIKLTCDEKPGNRKRWNAREHSSKEAPSTWLLG